jgi:hypothetical protein
MDDGDLVEMLKELVAAAVSIAANVEVIAKAIERAEKQGD